MALKVWLPLNKDLRSAGLSNVTVINSGATLDNNGIIGKCYNFTLGKYLGLDAPNVNNHKYSPISIALWVYPTQNDSTWRAIFGCWENGGSGLDLYNGKIEFGVFVNGSYTYCTMPSAIALNTWHHICGTYNENTMCLYVDGGISKTIQLSGPISYNATTPWQIGGNPGSTSWGSGTFVGKINDVRIYDNCLTPEDVKRIYQKKIFDLVPYSEVKNVLFDRSGFMLMPLVNNGAVYMGNSLYFNGGTTTRLRPKKGNVGLGNTGGTLSIWFSMSAAPSGYRILFVDSTSHFALGFYSNNSFIVGCNGSSVSTYSTSSVKFDGTMNNVTIAYNTSNVPQFCLINGATAATVSSNNWTEGGGLTIGGRTANDSCNFTGKIYKVSVYKEIMTQNDALKQYNSEHIMFLPDEYEELEYIESTGSQYINTEYVPNNTSGIYLKAYCTTQDGNYQAIGCRQNTGDSRWWINFSTTLEFSWNTWNATITGYTNNWVIVEHNYLNSRSAKVNGKVQSVNYPTLASITQKAYLFNANNQGNPGTGFKGRISNARITEGNVIVRNFIPAKRKSDSVIGMYDMVSRQFFTNAGTGSFTGA